MIKVTCLNCNRSYKLKDEAVGRTFRCKCGYDLTVSAESTAQAPPDEGEKGVAHAQKDAPTEMPPAPLEQQPPEASYPPPPEEVIEAPIEVRRSPGQSQNSGGARRSRTVWVLGIIAILVLLKMYGGRFIGSHAASEPAAGASVLHRLTGGTDASTVAKIFSDYAARVIEVREGGYTEAQRRKMVESAGSTLRDAVNQLGVITMDGVVDDVSFEPSASLCWVAMNPPAELAALRRDPLRDIQETLPASGPMPPSRLSREVTWEARVLVRAEENQVLSINRGARCTLRGKVVYSADGRSAEASCLQASISAADLGCPVSGARHTLSILIDGATFTVGPTTWTVASPYTAVSLEEKLSACRKRLKDIGLAIGMYQADYNEECPQTLEELIKKGYLKAYGDKSLLCCPNTGQQYVYLRPVNPKNIARPASTVMAYDARACAGGRRNILWFDLHVSTVSEDELRRALSAK